ncbi:MAG: PQQ-binding-like beta-propeller repeat protein [Acidobacteriota bacterium]
MKVFFAFFIGILFVFSTAAQPAWQAKLDSDVRFYQTTDFGVLLAGTDKDLYAVDGQTGSIVWRRKTGRINATGVTPVPGTDLVLLTRDLGDRSRLEAVDLMSGATIWQSDKVKGDVMQLAADPENDLIAVVLVKDANGRSGSELKRKPIVHVFKLSTGDEVWKREMDGAIEMMPAHFGDDKEVAFTLDNYRAPLMIDSRLFLFYEGATSYDARTGKEKEREKFKINENGLALTEADPVIDDTHIYMSGRGRVRAVNRRTGEVDWKADDLGVTPEMALVGQTLIVRTGGQFTRVKDGEIESKGPYGISAIDTSGGSTLWRFKGADKGLTNFVLGDANTIWIADRDDLISIDARSGKRIDKFKHNIDRAQFVLINEGGRPVVGGSEEMAAFERGGHEAWRVRHKPPGRGVLRIVGGLALRAAALYFRYGGVATAGFGLASGGLNLANTINSFRWSGLRTRFGSFDLTTLASNSAQGYLSPRIYTYGSIARNPGLLSRISGLEIRQPGFSSVAPSRADVEDSVFDRLDPARQADKLADYLLRRKRLAELRANYMYFYTDLEKPFSKKGLVGVNVQNGTDSRFVLVSDPDAEFVTDEQLGLLYSSDGGKLQAFSILNK